MRKAVDIARHKSNNRNLGLSYQELTPCSTYIEHTPGLVLYWKRSEIRRLKRVFANRERAAERAARAEKLGEMYRSGFSAASLGRIYGITEQRVFQLLPKEVMEQKRREKAKRNAAILRLRESGLTMKEIAGLFGLSATGVCDICKEGR